MFNLKYLTRFSILLFIKGGCCDKHSSLNIYNQPKTGCNCRPSSAAFVAGMSESKTATSEFGLFI